MTLSDRYCGTLYWYDKQENKIRTCRFYSERSLQINLQCAKECKVPYLFEMNQRINPKEEE